MIDSNKLAERAGFKCSIVEGYPVGTMVHRWVAPDKSLSTELPNFLKSLDACIKWLAPGRVSEITFMYASDGVSCDIEDLKGNFFEGHVDTESIEEAWTKSALAFCLAFEKQMEAKDDR